MAAVHTYFKIVETRFIDNVYRKIQRHIVDARLNWIKIGITSNENILNNANEPF